MARIISDRDLDIYNKSQEGWSLNELSKEFHLTPQRCGQIIIHTKRKLNREPLEIPEISKVCTMLHITRTYRATIQNVLWDNGYYKDEMWKWLTKDEIEKMNGLGPGAVWIVWLAQNLDLHTS